MQGKNYEKIEKEKITLCNKCNGVGHTLKNKKQTSNLTTFDVVPCKYCNNTGIYTGIVK